MDTWATSSLTPQIAGRWEDDPDLFARVFPMDLRPQAHEIIRTWLFATVVRAELEHGVLPWSDAAISGWVLDPDRKKMSKSKGTCSPPPPVGEVRGRRRPLLGGRRPAGDRHHLRRGADQGGPAPGHQGAQRVAVRPGTDRRPTRAPWSSPSPATVTAPLDRAMLARLAEVVEEATAAFEGYDYARALERTESFFWSFCDDYLELVKTRAYGEPGDPGPASARAALALALSVQLRLLAPVLPFVTEEVWSWWQAGSIHNARWPNRSEFDAALPDGTVTIGPVLDVVAEVLGQVRRAKTTPEALDARRRWPPSAWPTRRSASPPSCRSKTTCGTRAG